MIFFVQSIQMDPINFVFLNGSDATLETFDFASTCSFYKTKLLMSLLIRLSFIMGYLLLLPKSH